jgi:hypothetical protein
MVLCWVMVYSGGHERCRSVWLGFRAVPVGVAWGKSLIFFCLDAKETKSQGCASFLTGKSQADDSRLQTRLGAGWVGVVQGIP